MQKYLKKLIGNQRRKTSIIITAIGIFIAAVVVFIVLELDYNQKIYVENYKKEQQLLTDQVALHMGYLMDADTEITNVIDKIMSEVETNGRRYWFIAKDQDLLFVKNKNTSELFSNISVDSFLHQYQEDKIHISSSSFMIGEDQYIIGICTEEGYILESGQLLKHYIYIVMPIIVISAVLLVLIIFYMLQINRVENKIKQLQEEAIERNMTIEELTTRMKKVRLNDLNGTRSKSLNRDQVIYKKEVLTSLLSKINQDNMKPLTIIVIQLSSYFAKNVSEDYHSVFRSITGFLQGEYVMAEIAPGEFSILLFHTTSEQNEMMKKTLINQWALPMKKKGIKVRMGISWVEDYDTNVEKVFELVYKEVSGKLQEDDGQIRISS